MKATRLHEVGQPLKVEDVPIPEIGPRDVLIKVKACGICHSDILMQDGTLSVPRFPIIPGHQTAGVIARVGEAVEGIKVGQRVCVDSAVSCGQCQYCASGRDNLCSQVKVLGFDFDGGWAEYLQAPADSVFLLPEEIPFEQGAILTDPLTTCFHAMKRGKVKPGDVVTIFGTGSLAIPAIQAALVFGASKVIVVGRNSLKLEMVRAAGADEVINMTETDPVKQIRALTNGDGADVAVELIGLDRTIQQTIQCVKRGGRALLVGVLRKDVPINPFFAIAKEIDIKGVWTAPKQVFPAVIELVRSGRIDLSKAITHCVSLDEVNRGIEILAQRIGNPFSVVVTPEGPPAGLL